MVIQLKRVCCKNDIYNMVQRHLGKNSGTEMADAKTISIYNMKPRNILRTLNTFFAS